MKKIIFLIVVILFLPICAYTQVITYTQIEPSKFPTVTTNFVISDSNGLTRANVNTTDFEIYEQGVLIPNSTYTINCSNAPYKIILVLDQSTSMNDEIEGVRRWNMVIQGATTFINSLDLRNGSEIALETFGGESYWKCDFTNDKNRIIDSLNKVNPYGKTNFNVSFFGPNASSIDSLSIQPLGFKRIIVFLTDGAHNDDNDPVVKTDSILAACRTNNIQFFAITFQAPMNTSLAYIASNSNGADYVVASSDGLNQIYKVVANKIQNDVLCSLSWISNVICDEIDRLKSVKIYYKPYKSTTYMTYIVPEYGIARIQTDSVTYKFGNPDIGSYYDQEIILSPKNSPTSILSMSIVPSTYFSIIDYGQGQGVPPTYPINIPQDGQYKIKVRFTPGGVKTFRSANLQFNATPCPGIITLIGGIPEIFVDNPVKDQIFSACDTVNIKWSGVDSATSVDLLFSDNQGSTWKPIAKNLTNNNYNWSPPAIGENLLIKAEISPASTYIWAESGGGKSYDCAKSIAITPDNYYIYVAGFYNNTLFASDKFITSKGSTDAFLAKYDIDGNLQWIKSDGGVLSDSAIYVTADASGNAYYVGTCYSGATFGGLHPIMQVFNNQYLFIAKYSPSGQIQNVFTLGARDSFPDFRAFGRSVSISGNTVIVVGQYTGFIKIGNFTFPQTTTLRNFTIYLDLNLNVRSYSISGTFSTRTSVFDKNGYKYEIQNFTNYKNFGRFTVKSQGDYDFALTKFGLGSEGFDISDPFNVYYPNYVFTLPTLDVKSCLLGDTCSTNFTSVLHNNTNVPASISGFNLIFNPPTDRCFGVDSSIIGKILQPDESIDIPITFSTIKLGTNTA
ncbi:MAG TPA: vWA domain-containing protein, partial [Bacteroidota bacterium]|nr:vWA domain-containing protein [Bacteroidota bacterium]